MKLSQSLVKNIFCEIIEKARIIKSGSNSMILCGRCPHCGDSQKHKKKSRLYCIEKNTHYTIYCHNCEYSTNFEGLLAEHFPEKYNSIKNDMFDIVKNRICNPSFETPIHKINIIRENKKYDDFLKEYYKNNCLKLTEPTDNQNMEKYRNYALKKMKDRLISDFFLNQMYACHKGDYCWRVIIPFVDGNGLHYNFQARDIHPKPNEYRRDRKYLFALFENFEFPDEKIYGWYQISKNRPVYICEGIIDSMFINNAISLCNCNVSGAKSDFIRSEIDSENRIWCIDSPYHDKTGYEKIIKLLEMDETCVILPKHINNNPIKDINDLAKHLGVSNVPHGTLETVKGKLGLIKLKTMITGQTTWK